jgi:hypothetical protein
MNKKLLKFQLIWDVEENIWYCSSDDIPMVLESESYDTLISRIRLAAPDYMEHEGNYNGPLDIRFESVRVDAVKTEMAQAS